LEPPRCDWVAKGDPFYLAYHDTEWGVPAHDDRHLFEMLVLEGAQAGLSWSTILRKREGYREAFAGFDPKKIARFSEQDVDRLAQDTRVVRNRRKIEATVDNAVEMIELDREHGGFRNYLRSRGSFEDTVADLKRHFAFLGDTGSYYFLYVVGEKVPPHEEWMASRQRAR
jgi:DNA-3-methyladenine glycosylase I